MIKKKAKKIILLILTIICGVYMLFSIAYGVYFRIGLDKYYNRVYGGKTYNAFFYEKTMGCDYAEEYINEGVSNRFHCGIVVVHWFTGGKIYYIYSQYYETSGSFRVPCSADFSFVDGGLKITHIYEEA